MRCGSELLRSGPDVRRSRGLCADLRCPHGRSGLLRSRRCAHLRRSGCSQLLRSGSELLQHRLRLQSEEALVPRLVRQVQEQEEPLLRADELLQRCAQLRRSDLCGPDGTDLRRSGRGLLPLIRMFDPASVLTARLHPVG